MGVMAKLITGMVGGIVPPHGDVEVCPVCDNTAWLPSDYIPASTMVKLIDLISKELDLDDVKASIKAIMED